MRSETDPWVWRGCPPCRLPLWAARKTRSGWQHRSTSERRASVAGYMHAHPQTDRGRAEHPIPDGNSWAFFLVAGGQHCVVTTVCLVTPVKKSSPFSFHKETHNEVESDANCAYTLTHTDVRAHVRARPPNNVCPWSESLLCARGYLLCHGDSWNTHINTLPLSGTLKQGTGW